MVSKKKKDKNRIDLDTRPNPNPLFINYDYTDEPANETSPGGGLYHGNMDKYKSVTDFRKKKEKEKKRIKREALLLSILKTAGFPSRKQIINKDPHNKEKVNYISEKLEEVFGPKASKYFGMTWDAVIKSEKEIKEVVFDTITTYKTFHTIEKYLKRDFSKYKSYEDFKKDVEAATIRKAELEDANKSEKERKKLIGGVSKENVHAALENNNAVKIFEDEENSVYRINNIEGANALASDTSWCITKLQSPFYNQYTSRNLIFYFVFNKYKKLDDPYQKMAVRVMKEGASDIRDIKVTKKTNDSDFLNPEKEVPNWENFKNLIIEDAKSQPEGLLSKIKRGVATKEEAITLWNSHKNASIYEKNELLNYYPASMSFGPIEEFKDIKISWYSDDEINRADFKELDVATLERMSKSTYNEKLLKKLYKTNYMSVQANVAIRTKNQELLAKASFSDFYGVIESVVANKHRSISILKSIYRRFPVNSFIIKSLLIISEMSEEDKANQIKKRPNFVNDLINPSEELQRIAVVSGDPSVIRHIENPSREVQLLAIRKAPSAIRWIINPSNEILEESIKRNPFSIKYVRDKYIKLQEIAVSGKAMAIGLIRNPTEEIQLLAVNKSSDAFEEIENPTERVKELAVELDTDNIFIMDDPSLKSQLFAFNKNPLSIANLKNPHEEAQILVTYLGVIYFTKIKTPTERVKELAVILYGERIGEKAEFVLTERMNQLAAISRDLKITGKERVDETYRIFESQGQPELEQELPEEQELSEEQEEIVSQARIKMRGKLLKAVIKSANVIPYEIFKEKKIEQELESKGMKDMRELFPKDLLEQDWEILEYGPYGISAVLEFNGIDKAHLSIEYITEDDVKFDREQFGKFIMVPHVYFHLTSGDIYKQPSIIPLDLFLNSVPAIIKTIVKESVNEQ